MLLRGMNDCEQLFVLDVLARHRRRVQLAPVQNSLVQVPPAKVTRRVTLERDDGKWLILQEDPGSSEVRLERLFPPAGVSVSAVGELSD